MAVNTTVFDDQVLTLRFPWTVHLQFGIHMLFTVVRIENDHASGSALDNGPKLFRYLRGRRRHTGNVLDPRVRWTVGTKLEIDRDHLSLAHEIAQRCEVKGAAAIQRARLNDQIGFFLEYDLLVSP